MKTKVINISDIQSAIKMKGPVGYVVSALIMWILGLDKVNKGTDKNRDCMGPDYAKAVLRDLGVTYDIDPAQLENIPKEGAFITISNHPFGGVDGLILFDFLGRMRPDFKTMSNFLLRMIPNIKEMNLPVNSFNEGTSNVKSIAGIRMTKNHLAEGGVLGLFPAGEVSTIQKGAKRTTLKKGRVVEDIPWPVNIIKLIKTAGVPVVPIYFEGENSRLFHFLGKIHPFLRTLRLPRELFNKQGVNVPVRIGKPIGPSEIAEYKDILDLRGYLRSRVYALQGELDDANKRLVQVSGPEQPYAVAKMEDEVTRELEANKDKMLFDVASYQGYLLEYDDIPVLIHEIGRCREEAFRRIGEGTNQALDTDEYDKYYKHLIVWDNNKKKLVGGYRFGIGEEIFERHGGTKGFYTNYLFDYKEGLSDVLKETIELGRSFVAVEYQKENLPLMLLFKGIMHTMVKYPRAKYLIGPVSISNSYPRFYQSLMVYYLSKKYSTTIGKGNVGPRTPFEYDFLKVNPDMLIANKMETFEKFDRFLLRLSDGKYKFPTLVKKYVKLGARIFCFNVDPLFNYCLDALIILQLDQVPKSEIEMLIKEITDETERNKIFSRFGYGTGS